MSTVTTCSKMNNILGTKNSHINKLEETVKTQIQEVHNEYSKASNDIHERHRKIMRKEMLSMEKKYNYTKQ